MSEIPPTITEARLRESYGLTVKAFAALRTDHLLPGEHWKKEGREICYTPEGEKRLTELLGAPLPAVEPGPAVPEVCEFVIVKILHNRRIVEARKKDATELPADPPPETELCGLLGLTPKALASLRHQRLQRDLDWEILEGTVSYTAAGWEKLRQHFIPPVRIRVKDSAKLRKGMTLRAIPQDEAAGLWSMIGKLPRTPGRW